MTFLLFVLLFVLFVLLFILFVLLFVFILVLLVVLDALRFLLCILFLLLFVCLPLTPSVGASVCDSMAAFLPLHSLQRSTSFFIPYALDTRDNGPSTMWSGTRRLSLVMMPERTSDLGSLVADSSRIP